MINNPFYPKISQTETPKSQISDFEIQCELGHGSFGTVYKVKRKTDGKIYALKKVYLNQLKEKEKQNSLNEIRILASINNKNIIQYKGSFYDNINNSLCLVMEYAENGDLEKKILTRQKKNFYYQEYEILNMIIQIIKGLKSLHDYKIMHRDIKSANIFLFNDNIVKIGDLNVSKILKNNLHNTQTGTPYYASPEIWENKSYDFKSDIWSLGCLIYEICSLKAPFRGSSMKMVYDKVIKGIYDPIPKIYSRALGGIVYICLQVNPINRPNCEQLLNIIYQQSNLFNLGGKKIFDFEDFDFGKGNFNLGNNSFLLGESYLDNYNISNINNNNNNNNNDNGNEEINKLLNTIKMPKKLNDINLILPKNRYTSSTSRRNIQSAMNKIKNKLPKINFEQKNFMNFINEKINNINSNDNYHYKNISTIDKEKILNHNYSETNVINQNPVYKNIGDKYNNMNYNSSYKNSENGITDEIKEDINTSDNVSTNGLNNQNSQKNNIIKISDSSEKTEKLLEEIEKQNRDIMNCHYINKKIDKSNSNNNSIINNKNFRNNNQINKINSNNNILNKNKNNINNNQNRMPQRSQSYNRYNLSYLNQLTEINNNKDLSLVNVNFNNLSYITNINSNNNPVKIPSKNNNYEQKSLKKKIFQQNLNSNNNNNLSNNEKVLINIDENKFINLYSPKSKNDNTSEKSSTNQQEINNENKKLNSPIKNENNKQLKKHFQRNFQISEKDKKRAISAFNKRNKIQRNKSYLTDKNNHSYIIGINNNLITNDNLIANDNLSSNNINNNINLKKNNHHTINTNSPIKKEKTNNINFNIFNRRLNRNSLNIKKNYNNFYNNNNQQTIDSIKLRTRKNNSNINVHLPTIDNNTNKNEIITTTNGIYETINSNNSKKIIDNNNIQNELSTLKKNLDSSIEKQLKKPKKINAIPLSTKFRNNEPLFYNFKKFQHNKNPIRIHPLIQGLDNSINDLIGNKKSNIDNIIIPHFNDAELLDNNIKKLIKNFKITEKIEE